MADAKISGLTAATYPFTGKELVPIVKDGVNVKAAVYDFDRVKLTQDVTYYVSVLTLGSLVGGLVMSIGLMWVGVAGQERVGDPFVRRSEAPRERNSCRMHGRLRRYTQKYDWHCLGVHRPIIAPTPTN